MRHTVIVGVLLITLGATMPLRSAEPERSRPPVPEELTDAWERFQRALQEWGGRVWERFGRGESRENRPLITQMLANKEQLGLSADQVKRIEQLRDNFQRQSIRHDADLRIVELDIAAAMESEPVDLAKVESKIREAEKMRSDLRIARVRAIEQARGILTAEQKRKLQDMGR